jgi:hypothetical protein
MLGENCFTHENLRPFFYIFITFFLFLFGENCTENIKLSRYEREKFLPGTFHCARKRRLRISENSLFRPIIVCGKLTDSHDSKQNIVAIKQDKNK